jgi:hypothetical protein
MEAFLPPGVHEALRGKPFFPCKSDKTPAVAAWRPFADRLPNDQEIASWKNHGGPWGMPCGPPSYVVIDFDGEEGRKFYEEKFDGGVLPPTALTPKGYHAYFAYPEDKGTATLLKNAVRLFPGVDIRCLGGYVITPSAYGDGRGWIQAPDIPAPELPDWIIDALRKDKGPQGIVSPSVPDGLPARAEKGTRNKMVSIHAGRYLGKGLSAEETTSILIEWNRRNPEPLDAEEVRKTVFSIARRENEKGPVIELVDSGDLDSLATIPRKNLIAPFLRAGSKAILAGTYGVGKSLFALNWSVSTRNAFPIFGRFDTERARVLYVDRENPAEDTNFRIKKICAGMHGVRGGITFQFPKEKPDLAQPKIREAYIRTIEKGKYDLVIFDSFLCFFNLRNENDNTEVRNVLELVGEIPAKTGAALLILDHAGKATAEKERAGIKVTPRGATAKGDWADLVMTLEDRKDEARKLCVLRFLKSRFSPPLPPIILERGPNFVYTPSGTDEICPIPTVRQVVEDTPGIAAKELYRHLAAQVGCSERTAMKSTARTVDLGFIRREEKGKYVNFHPTGLVKSEDFTNNEGQENGGQKTLEYQ